MGRREWRDEKGVGKAMRELVDGDRRRVLNDGKMVDGDGLFGMGEVWIPPGIQ